MEATAIKNAARGAEQQPWRGFAKSENAQGDSRAGNFVSRPLKRGLADELSH